MSDLLLRLKKSSKIDRTNILSKSDFFRPTKPLPTPIYGLNIAMGASLKGGVTPGLVVWAGPSKHFKTSYVLLCLKAYLDADPNAIGMWYDSEFGSPQSYFEAFGIDTNRVLHVPITNIEDLKFDLINQLNEIKRGDKVMICVDSVGNLASKKEVEDAINEKAVADMTRAKQLKSLFRMVTPILTLKDLPMHVVNHTYQCGTEEMTVSTPDRGPVSLKDIKVGDSVYTLNGIEEVSFTTKHEGAFVTDIEMEDGSVLSFTDGHRFMVNGKWKYVCDLCVGDDIQLYEEPVTI